jgi:peptide/nickel transport system permease protein
MKKGFKRNRILYLCWSRLTAIALVFLVIFFVSRLLPGDPVELYLTNKSDYSFNSYNSILKADSQYLATAHRYGLADPVFYFSISPLSSLNHTNEYNDIVYIKKRRQFLNDYIRPHSKDYLLYVKNMLMSGLKSGENKQTWIAQWINPNPEKLLNYYNQNHEITLDSNLQKIINELKPVKTWKKMIPILNWNGSNNQFHRWFTGIVSGDWGTSIKDSQPVWDRLSKSLGWTLSLNIPSILILVFISIKLGIIIARFKSLWSLRIVFWILNVLYAIPVFILGVFVLGIASKVNLWYDPIMFESTEPLNYISFQRFANLWLPAICLILPSLAILSRQVSLLISIESRKPYAIYLWLRGVKTKKIYSRYLLRNTLIPLSSDLAKLIPAVISGSLLIEIIFNVPGMGRLLYESIYARDWPLLNGVLLLSATFAVIGVLISDLLLYSLNRGERNAQS